MERRNELMHKTLEKAKDEDRLPKIITYNRIDGPGSSLDLKLFQQSMWRLPNIPKDPYVDEKMTWSMGLPRTIGMSINVGTEITVEVIEPGKLGVESFDFGFSYIYDLESIPPKKENWLLKIMEAFGLDGVRFVMKNTNPEIKSAGLGGSAALTTGVCILANKLTGNLLNPTQLVAMASMMEQDFAVSLTGTQEQSCAMFGGVRDYIWFPFGIPKQNNSYGASIAQEILKAEGYDELRKRLDVYFVEQRRSIDVNSIWYQEMEKTNGFKLHKNKCMLAYLFREAIRTKNWDAALKPIADYKKIRTQLCPHYVPDAVMEIEELCKQYNIVSFPLGGGGSTMFYSPNPKNLESVRSELSKKFKHIDYKIMPHGHVLKNLDGFEKDG